MPAKRAALSTPTAQRPTSPSSAAASPASPSRGAPGPAACSVLVLDRGELGAGTSRRRGRDARARHGGRRAERALLLLGLRQRPPLAGLRRRAARTSRASTSATGRTGTLVVARDRDEAEALDRELALRDRLGLRAQRLLPSRAPRRGARAGPDGPPGPRRPRRPRRRPAALTAALARRPPRAPASVLRPGAEVARRAPRRRARAGRAPAGRHGGARRRGPRGGRPLVRDAGGLPADARVPVRPVKGQTVCGCATLAGPARLLVGRVVRFDGGYLVPRGRRAATCSARPSRSAGFDTSMTAGGGARAAARRRRGRARRARARGRRAPRRPAPRDARQRAGARREPALDGLFWATGHHRNGILLAPVTADLVAAELAGEAQGTPSGPGASPPSSRRAAGVI